MMLNEDYWPIENHIFKFLVNQLGTASKNIKDISQMNLMENVNPMQLDNQNCRIAATTNVVENRSKIRINVHQRYANEIRKENEKAKDGVGYMF
jgi:hypothetical protein